MTNKELLEVLSNTKTARALELARNPLPPPPPPPLPEVNWIERKMEKNTIMLRYLKILIYCFLGLMLFVIMPVLSAFPYVGRSMMMGLPPILFIAATWMAGAWYAWDKEFPIFMALTLGAMPIRIAAGCLWSVFAMGLPGIDVTAYFAGMMIFWIAFTIPEFGMLIDFSNKLPRNGGQVEP